MTDPNELGLAIATIADILDDLAVRWAVGGSIASSTYGEQRSTNDVDLVAALTKEAARALVARLGEHYYVDVDAAVDAVRRTSSFNIIDQ